MKAIRYWLVLCSMLTACLPWTDLVLTKPGMGDEPVDTDDIQTPPGYPGADPEETGQFPEGPPEDTYEPEEPEDTYELWFPG